MTTLLRFTLLALLLRPASPARAANTSAPPPTEPGAAVLFSSVGADGIELLASRGYAVFQGKGAGLRLIHAQWPTLEALSARSAAVGRFAAAYADFMGGKTPVEVPDASLSQLPASGLMTPTLRLAKLLLAASRAEFDALAGPVGAAGAPGPTLFETSWGKRFSSRTHADSLEDPAPLAKPFFDEYLSGPNPDAGVQKHFTDHILAAYQMSIGEIIEADAKAGAPSEESRAWIRKYLTDQRRLYAVKRFREELRKLDRRKAVSRDMADLTKIAGALAKESGLLARLKEAMDKPAVSPRVFISSAGIHLNPPEKLGRNEKGDAVSIDEGYWVHGLQEGEKTEVEETTFADYGALGIRELEKHSFMRANGGPYALTHKVRLHESKSFVFRSFVGAAEAALFYESVEVPVADDIDRAQGSLAQADHQALACDFKNAETSYEKLAAELAAPAKDKKQYKELLTSAQWRKRMAKRNAGRLAKLEEEINASREDSSPQKCAYKTDRTESALRLARSLPAGCDKLVPELDRQLATISRRRDDQRNFSKAAEAGSDLRKNCRFPAASQNWASALAILDADPAARCGAVDEKARFLEGELTTLRLEERHTERFDADFQDAASAPDKEASLKLLRPLIARSASMPTASCFEGKIAGAMKLVLTLGEAQYSAPAGDPAARLPEDKALSGVSDEIADDLRKTAAAIEAAKAKKLEQQVPALPETALQAPPPAPKAQPIAVPAPEPKPSRSRLQCLEEGFKKNETTIDCDGKDFDILELKRLRQKPKARKKTKAGVKK